jgi:hypothetical protein
MQFVLQIEQLTGQRTQLSGMVICVNNQDLIGGKNGHHKLFKRGKLHTRCRDESQENP